jgi:hypothetical protein
MDNNLPNLNADELSAYASAKHLAGVPDNEIQRSIVQMLKNDGWKEAAIAPMINEIARRTKGVAETKGSPRSPPKAAQDATAAMMAALTQLTQMMVPITSRLEALEQQSAQQTPPAQTPKSHLDPVGAPTLLVEDQALITRKSRLPDPERFDGTREKYASWKYECEGKLECDSALYPDENTKKRYVLSRTTGRANQVLLPWLVANRDQSVSELWKHLDQRFQDVHQADRAIDKLRHLRQGKRSVRDYAAEFNQLRIQSGLQADARIIREMFSEGLNVKLQKFLVDAPKDRTFEEQANKAIKISDRLYRIQLTSKNRGGARVNRSQSPTASRSRDASEEMDWEPTRVSKASAKDKRLNSNQIECYSCGNKGHIARNCNKGAKARSVKASRAAQRESPSACKCHAELSDSNNSEDPGKE